MITVDLEEFEKNLLDAVREALYLGLLRVRPALQFKTREAVGRALAASPEASSLLEGDLRSQFGITNAQPAVDAILVAIQNSVVVDVNRGTGGEHLASLSIQALRADMSDVLGLSQGRYESKSILRNTTILIPWLQWLLLEGDNLIITDFEINTQKERPASRTGRAIMIKATKRPSRGFHVPNDFAGVVDNNWLTRVMADAAPGVIEAIQSSLRLL